ncbi:acyl-coenzyme A synthetase ACSM3, mitochondrial-like isoform X2 [Heteronotia binoei]|uniref:acyl-coenzyme A synthetase ACSM3, mitochondrial-like isoform X2 n=1 Tax=Heteronotia binoei TaxID=13085 RepID=UPI00292D1D29|nr:acyl-coenzyme A synthetase ACSM3, mitochondrial-like isoform X2 [Heteronotia binoei]
MGRMKLLTRLPVLGSFSGPRVLHRVKSCRGVASLGSTDYESLFRDVPEHFNFASDVLDKWDQKEKDGTRPPNPALWWISERGEEVQWSFEELGVLSRKAANVLTNACDLQKGDRVIVILPRIPEWWTITVGCMRAGIVFVPATVLLSAKDILYRLQASKAKSIITDDALAPLVDSVVSNCHFLKSRILVSEGRREGWMHFHDLIRASSDQHQPVKTRSQDPMTIYFTSGTTGYPKMVEHSCCSLGLGLAPAGRYWMGLNPESIMWGLSDTGWVKFVFGSVFGPWIEGSCIFAHGKLQFEPTNVLNTLASYPVTTFCGTPTIFRMLLQHNVSSYHFKSLKYCLSGGEPMNPETMEHWKAQTGMEIQEGYGQTETTLLCGTLKGMKVKPGFIGKPCPPFTVQVINEQGNCLPPGEEGDIAVRIKPKRPVGLFTNYVDDPEKTASTERGDFYITGDRGLTDEDGYIRFIARADDIILSAGYRIGPFEVENALAEHPAVAESAVVSSPDPIRGEVVKAFIILTPAYQSHNMEKLIVELQEHVKKVTAPYKYPRKIEFVQQLPKTISGKIQRKLLRKKEWGAA